MERAVLESWEIKLNRLSSGKAPRVVDLFSGCGGMSLGFQKAGFEITAGVEIDPIAAETHFLNFESAKSPASMSEKSHAKDITLTAPSEILHSGKKDIDLAVDVLVGGPPCQAFARVGRAKLREVADHPEAFIHDERAQLYLRYLEYVQELRPLAVLMENVPDILNFGGNNIAQEFSEQLERHGYVCHYTLLNSAYYGVPQTRERMFLIAYSKRLGCVPEFPSPTHWVDLPKGYEGTRRTALKSIEAFRSASADPHHYIKAPIPHHLLRAAVTAREALDDLPRITEHLNGDMPRGARRFENFVPYPRHSQLSEFACLMRNWPQFASTDGIYDHVIRSLPRDYRIFNRMNAGDQYPQAHAHAINLFEEHLRTIRPKVLTPKEGSQEWERIRKEFVPPYDVSKFPNKWRKMEPDCPARTLMAHLGKDGYSHIHYDSNQARTISVREAARLQSFPDGFRFAGTMNPAFKQIGNAVPPLIANALAEVIKSRLNAASKAYTVAHQVFERDGELRDLSI